MLHVLPTCFAAPRSFPKAVSKIAELLPPHAQPPEHSNVHPITVAVYGSMGKAGNMRFELIRETPSDSS